MGLGVHSIRLGTRDWSGIQGLIWDPVHGSGIEFSGLGSRILKGLDEPATGLIILCS